VPQGGVFSCRFRQSGVGGRRNSPRRKPDHGSRQDVFGAAFPVSGQIADGAQDCGRPRCPSFADDRAEHVTGPDGIGSPSEVQSKSRLGGSSMAVLRKQALQRLAVLHALSMWRRGAYGPVRVHKTLFFADKDGDPDWRLFTFKKWRLGQYSDEIADALNELREAGRITSWYDGPCERLRAEMPFVLKKPVRQFFADYFAKWNESLTEAFSKVAYLSNDAIVDVAHSDPTYKTSEHGQVIFTSFDHEEVEFVELDDRLAEDLSDLVDTRLHAGLEKQLSLAVDRRAVGEDWRIIYFGSSKRAAKAC